MSLLPFYLILLVNFSIVALSLFCYTVGTVLSRCVRVCDAIEDGAQRTDTIALVI